MHVKGKEPDVDPFSVLASCDLVDGKHFEKKLTICELEDGSIVGALWHGHFRILYCFTGPGYEYLEDQIITRCFAWDIEESLGFQSCSVSLKHNFAVPFPHMLNWGFRLD